MTRRTAKLIAAVVALGALASCASTPSQRRVVRDQIEALGLPADQERCMLARVQDYSDNQLEAIGNANVDFDPAAGDSLEGTTDDFQDFVADLRSCLDGSSSDLSVAETSTPGDAAATTERSETTDA